MTEKTSRTRFFILTSLAAVIIYSLGRVISVLYSHLSTDIMYMYTTFPDILDYLKQLSDAAGSALFLAAGVFAAVRFGKKALVQTGAIACGFFFLDFAAAFIIDVLSSSIDGREVIAAINIALSFSGEVLTLCVIYIALWFIIKHAKAGGCAETEAFKRGSGSFQALICAVCIDAGIEFVLLTADVVSFLIEVDFAPYLSEVASIAGDYISVILIGGVLCFAAAAGIYVLYQKIN